MEHRHYLIGVVNSRKLKKEILPSLAKFVKKYKKDEEKSYAPVDQVWLNVADNGNFYELTISASDGAKMITWVIDSDWKLSDLENGKNQINKERMELVNNCGGHYLLPASISKIGKDLKRFPDRSNVEIRLCPTTNELSFGEYQYTVKVKAEKTNRYIDCRGFSKQTKNHTRIVVPSKDLKKWISDMVEIFKDPSIRVTKNGAKICHPSFPVDFGVDILDYTLPFNNLKELKNMEMSDYVVMLIGNKSTDKYEIDTPSCIIDSSEGTRFEFVTMPCNW